MDRSVRDTKADIEEVLKVAVKKFGEEYQQEVISIALESLKTVMDGLGSSGISDIKIKIPEQKPIAISLGTPDLILSAIEKKKRVVEGYKYGSGVIDTVAQFFGDLFNERSWGKVYYKYDVEDYKVDLNALEKSLADYMDDFSKHMANEIEYKIRMPVTQTSHDFFSQIRGKIGGIRGDLMRNLQMKQEDHASKSQKFKQWVEKVRPIRTDLDSVLESVEDLNVALKSLD